MKFLHFGLGIAAYMAALLFATLALMDDYIPFAICSILSLVLGEICHRRMLSHD